MKENYIKVLKRNGEEAEYQVSKIVRAIYNAAIEQTGDKQKSHKIAKEVADDVDKLILEEYEEITVEKVQDIVEYELLRNGHYEIGKSYIIYRHNRNRNRKLDDDKDKLSSNFISQYKHKQNPFPTELGEYVYYRTYSRLVPEEMRREYWWETVRRAVEYNTSLAPTSKNEAEELFENIYSLKNFVAGRTLWSGSTSASKKFPMSNYNCSGTTIQNIKDFEDIFYLLLIGSGTGFRVLPEDVKKLPEFRTNITVTHKYHDPVDEAERNERTEFKFDTDGKIATIIVGDSKEAWVQSLYYFLDFLTSSFYRDLEYIIFDYDNIRGKGERLKTFGGTASGHQSLKKMFEKIDIILKKKDEDKVKLKPIDALDIANIIAENVVSGGVRRSSQVGIFDVDDEDIAQAKSDLYIQKEGEWITNPEIAHRTNSNNSIFYKEKPAREKLKWHVKQMRFSGEPGFINAEEASRRRENFEVVNPCVEILLSSKGVCNLTSLNVSAFIDNNDNLMLADLLRAQELSARAGYRMASVDFELNEWDIINKRDMLIGTSVTGWQDAMNRLGWSDFDIPQAEEYETLMADYEGREAEFIDLISRKIRNSENYQKQAGLMKKLRETAQQAAKVIAKELDGPEPLLVTTVKPEGTQSQMPTVSNGLHFSHSEYYVRRVRINDSDPLVKATEDLNYPIFNDTHRDNTAVIEFPVKAPEGKVKADVYAIEQLEIYRLFMKHYVDHNASSTIHVRDNEWNLVEEWLWENWDDVVGVSFLSYSDSFYDLMPYEEIDEQEYQARLSKIKPFKPSLVNKYERELGGYDIDLKREEGLQDCEDGACPVR